MKLLFLGHSLIAFFDWQRRFPGHDVTGLGVAGESVEGLLDRLDRVITLQGEADAVFIMTGANNVVMDDLDFIGPLRRIVAGLKAAWPKAVIAVHTVFPMALEGIENSDIRKVNGKLLALARETNVELIDLYGAFSDGEERQRREYFLEDGVHLSEGGYALWSGALEEFIAGKVRPPREPD